MHASDAHFLQGWGLTLVISVCLFWRYKISPWRSVVVCRVKSSVETRQLQNFFFCCVIERALREIRVLAFCATLACRACGVDACLVAPFSLSFPQIRPVSHRTCGCGFAGFHRPRAVAQPPEGGEGRRSGRSAWRSRGIHASSSVFHKWQRMVGAPQCCGANSGASRMVQAQIVLHTGPVHVTRQQIGGQGGFSHLGQPQRILKEAHLNMLVQSAQKCKNPTPPGSINAKIQTRKESILQCARFIACLLVCLP